MRRYVFRPAVTKLEPRELPATAVANLVAKPSLLTPPNNRFVRIQVTGNVVENREKITPDVDFQVIDEYRRIEPAGPVKLLRVTPTVYSFKFPIFLQAKRASEDKPGRQYYLTVGTSDMDNSQGLTVPILVPYGKARPGPNGVRSSAHMKLRVDPT